MCVAQRCVRVRVCRVRSVAVRRWCKGACALPFVCGTPCGSVRCAARQLILSRPRPAATPPLAPLMWWGWEGCSRRREDAEVVTLFICDDIRRHTLCRIRSNAVHAETPHRPDARQPRQSYPELVSPPRHRLSVISMARVHAAIFCAMP